MANQFAVITGASSGIGFELARQFVSNGFGILINAEDAAGLDSASAGASPRPTSKPRST